MASRKAGLLPKFWPRIWSPGEQGSVGWALSECKWIVGGVLLGVYRTGLACGKAEVFQSCGLKCGAQGGGVQFLKISIYCSSVSCIKVGTHLIAKVCL